MLNVPNPEELRQAFDAEHNWLALHNGELRNLGECFAHRGVWSVVDHENQRHLFAFVAFGLEHGRDPDLGGGKDCCDAREHARTIHDAQADVILRRDLIERQYTSTGGVRDEWWNTQTRAILQIKRRIRNVAPNRARCRILPGAAAVEQCVAHNVAAYETALNTLLTFARTCDAGISAG